MSQEAIDASRAAFEQFARGDFGAYASLPDEFELVLAQSVGPQARDVRLKLPTFSATAEMAALSRAMGGYHIPTDNVVGLDVGRRLAAWSWTRYQAYFEGTARPRD